MPALGAARTSRWTRALSVAAAVALGVTLTSGPAASTAASADELWAELTPSLPRPGTVVRSEPLRRGLWVPEVTSKAWRLTYVTRDSHGARALSTGTVLVPHGRPPKGGWPVISWAHGLSGLGDDCAPSKVGPVMKERDWAYLGRWMREGYAVVASDYVGLGTPGLMPYMDGRATAHSVVDMVKAGRAFTAERRPRVRLAERWVTIGQSQGGGASIYTARHATAYGGGGLDFRGAVGTGTPAYIEDYVMLLGPEVPPLTPSLGAYLTYIVASLRYVHPELGIDGILTEKGKKYVAMAETMCEAEFAEAMTGVGVGEFFSAPMAVLPDLYPTLKDYMGMPESGFDTPFFIAHGALDIDVPYAQTARYAETLAVSGEPVTFTTYAGDHNSTMEMSLADTVPFVKRQMRR